MLIKFAEDTIARADTSPQIKALLETREIDIIPMLNPGGYTIVENGFAGRVGGDYMQRKNPREVDLNRNFDFNWGGDGSSEFPFDEDYRGQSAASEPETRALQNFMARRNPDIYIDWHSFGNDVLYPWGHTEELAPDNAGLIGISEGFTRLNKYHMMQSVGLYPTSGTTDDYAYATYGAPAFTIETTNDFFPSEKGFAKAVARNLPVMRWAARIADKPYERAQGPDAELVKVSRGATRQDPGTIEASVSDVSAMRDAVSAAEWVLDPRTAPGNGHEMTAVDGAFDSVREVVRGSIPANLRGGDLIYVRGRDALGNWGPARPQFVPQRSRPVN
jgi:hypothetical protein